jgi:hypothetical protein
MQSGISGACESWKRIRWRRSLKASGNAVTA